MQIGAEMRREPKLGDKLTIQETAVCEMMAAGMTSKEIARQMDKSHHTINDYRKKILRKTGARNLADVVRNFLTDKFTKGPKS